MLNEHVDGLLAAGPLGSSPKSGGPSIAQRIREAAEEHKPVRDAQMEHAAASERAGQLRNGRPAYYTQERYEVEVADAVAEEALTAGRLRRALKNVGIDVEAEANKAQAPSAQAKGSLPKHLDPRRLPLEEPTRTLSDPTHLQGGLTKDTGLSL